MLKFLSRRLVIIAVGFIGAIALTLLSSNKQQVGPELGIFGNSCGPGENEVCYEPILNGGFPVPYLFDNPGISVRGSLHFFEDEIRVLPFLIDVLLIGTILSGVGLIGENLLCRNISK
jgi:hypothetical protein